VIRWKRVLCLCLLLVSFAAGCTKKPETVSLPSVCTADGREVQLHLSTEEFYARFGVSLNHGFRTELTDLGLTVTAKDGELVQILADRRCSTKGENAIGMTAEQILTQFGKAEEAAAGEYTSLRYQTEQGRVEYLCDAQGIVTYVHLTTEAQFEPFRTADKSLHSPIWWESGQPEKPVDAELSQVFEDFPVVENEAGHILYLGMDMQAVEQVLGIRIGKQTAVLHGLPGLTVYLRDGVLVELVAESPWNTVDIPGIGRKEADVMKKLGEPDADLALLQPGQHMLCYNRENGGINYICGEDGTIQMLQITTLDDTERAEIIREMSVG